MKKLFKIMFFITLALTLLFVLLIAASIASAAANHTGGVGIIGGADGPTAILLTKILVFENPLVKGLCITIVLFVASLIGWLITRKK